MTKVRERMDIERVVEWAYRVECIDRAKRDSLTLASSGPGDVASSAAANIIALGCRVDTPPASVRFASCGANVNEDAWVVDQAVMQLPPEACILMIQHGRVGSRPDWMPEGVGVMEPVKDGRGRVKHLWRDQRNRRGELACLVRNTGASWPIVEHVRAQYSVWYEALVVLAGALSCQLERIEVLPPVVSSCPWRAKNSHSHPPMKLSA